MRLLCIQTICVESHRASLHHSLVGNSCWRSFCLSESYQTSQVSLLWFQKFLNFSRVEEEIEIRGLDIKKHGEPGYPIAAQGHGWNEMSSSEEIQQKNYQKNQTVPEPWIGKFPWPKKLLQIAIITNIKWVQNANKSSSSIISFLIQFKQIIFSRRSLTETINWVFYII